MKKKKLLISLFSAFMCISCNQGISSSLTNDNSLKSSDSSFTIDTNDQLSTNPDEIKKRLTISYEGKLEVGEDITLIIQDENNNQIKGLQIVATQGSDKVSILLYFVQLLKSGSVTLEIVDDEYEGSIQIEIEEKKEEILSIKQIKTLSSIYENEMVTTQGYVTASIGNSFYIGDGDSGIYVYNIHSIYTNSDAFEQGIIPVGIKVQVHAKLTNNSYGIQLNGYDGEYIRDAYVNKVEDASIDTPNRIIVQTEEELQDLMKTPYRNGEQISITGQYISGDLSSLYNDKNALINMKIDNTEFTLKADRYDISSSNIYSYWNNANIDVGDILTINSTFTYYNGSQITVALTGNGTTLNNDSKDPSKLRLNIKEKFVSVNKSITLDAFVPEGLNEEVTYEIISGNEFAKIEGNILTGLKEGIIKIIAKTSTFTSYPLTLQIIANESQTIQDVLNLDKGGDVEVLGKITAIDNSGFIISDTTNSIYVYDGRTAIYDENEFSGSLGKIVKIRGIVDEFYKNNHKQITNYTLTFLEETMDFEVDFTTRKVTDLENLSSESFDYLIPIHLTGEAYINDSNIMLIKDQNLENALFYVLDYTMWHTMSISFGGGQVDSDGFIAGKTIYDGTVEYYFYFVNPYFIS